MESQFELTRTISQHIKILSKMHENTKRLLTQHKRNTRTILQWPSPFILTEERQRMLTKQQTTQLIPDHIIEKLLQIQTHLNQLNLYLNQLNH